MGKIGAARGRPPLEVANIQAKLVELLGLQREYMVKLDRLQKEKEELSERLESASLRYVKAEKRLDRAKSSAVAKLEAQAIASSTGTGIGGGEEKVEIQTNGVKETNDDATQARYLEATAIIEKQKEQLETISTENKSLTEQLTAASTRLASISEEDYAKTDLFKQFKIQHEDVIRRINHLEATNIQLREEAERYQVERTSYRTQLENEQEIVVGEVEAQLQRIDGDLSRVRSQRDELLADQAVRKAAQEQDRQAVDLIQELVKAKEDRIVALESEVRRIQTEAAQHATESNTLTEIESFSLEELRQKYGALRQSFDAINVEMPALQDAYRRVQALSSKKVMDFTALEEKVTMLIAEKSKADQKYFAARKDMDTRLHEVKSLRAQNAKSSEIITQLKDVETANRTLVSNLEKQLSDIRQANLTTAADNKRLESTNRECASKMKTSENQVTELTSLLKQKDSAHSSIKDKIMATERESEALQKRLETLQKDRDHWKTKSHSNSTGEEDMLRVGLPARSPSALLTLLDSCPLYSMPEQLQKHCAQRLRSHILRQVHRGSPHQSNAQMSELCQAFRQERHAGRSPLAAYVYTPLSIPTQNLYHIPALAANDGRFFDQHWRQFVCAQLYNLKDVPSDYRTGSGRYTNHWASFARAFHVMQFRNC